MMSKHDYEAAATIVRCLPEEDRLLPFLFYSALFMVDGNPRFNKHVFRRACRVPGDVNPREEGDADEADTNGNRREVPDDELFRLQAPVPAARE